MCVSPAQRERGPGGLTREAETPLPSNHPRGNQVIPFQLNTIPCYARQCYGRLGMSTLTLRTRHERRAQAEEAARTAGGLDWLGYAANHSDASLMYRWLAAGGDPAAPQTPDARSPLVVALLARSLPCMATALLFHDGGLSDPRFLHYIMGACSPTDWPSGLV